MIWWGWWLRSLTVHGAGEHAGPRAGRGGFLDKQGTTRPTYALGRNRRFEQRFAREGLAEDVVWFERLLPLLRDLPRNVLDIAHHGVTEMVNNAVDHSDATHVTVRMERRDGQLRFEIVDDGIGIFRKITRAGPAGRTAGAA